MLTDQQGNYEFETIMPGRYPVPPNLPGLEKYAGLTRPAHVHFRVSESLHIPLTTQLYFKDDPHIAKDPWASRKPSMAIGLNRMESSCGAIWTSYLPEASRGASGELATRRLTTLSRRHSSPPTR